MGLNCEELSPGTGNQYLCVKVILHRLVRQGRWSFGVHLNNELIPSSAAAIDRVTWLETNAGIPD